MKLFLLELSTDLGMTCWSIDNLPQLLEKYTYWVSLNVRSQKDVAFPVGLFVPHFV